MASEENFEFLKKGGRRYILGTQRGQLKQYEAELSKTEWKEVQSGLEVKLVDSPDGKEIYILCRSRGRAEKEKAIHDRFEQRIEEALKQMARSCEKRRYRVGVMCLSQRIEPLLGPYPIYYSKEERINP